MKAIRYRIALMTLTLSGILALPLQAHADEAGDEVRAFAIEPPPSTALLPASSFRLEDLDQPHLNMTEPQAAPATLADSPPPATAAGPGLTPPPPSPEEPLRKPDGKGWTKGLTRMEIAFQAIHLADMATTLECMNRPTCKEQNVILGSRPSKAEIIGFTAATGVLHYLLARLIANSNTGAAKLFVGTTGVVKGVVVGLNINELN